jgi:LSD1 subclass zinc finger protein
MSWKELLPDLVCPACRAPLALTPKEDGLKCAACKRLYPVRDDIPVLLVSEARIEE